jgi:hypothetical protein
MEEVIKKPTKLIRKKVLYPDGANTPTYIDVHRCFCRLGRIEHHRTPGFDDDFLLIKCPMCRAKYSYVDQCGYDWKVYMNKT